MLVLLSGDCDEHQCLRTTESGDTLVQGGMDRAAWRQQPGRRHLWESRVR